MPRPIVVVWDVLSDILRAEQRGKKSESNREEDFLLWQCYRENWPCSGWTMRMVGESVLS